MEQPLTGLTVGASYDISIVATSQHLPGDPMEDYIRLGNQSFTSSFVGVNPSSLSPSPSSK